MILLKTNGRLHDKHLRSTTYAVNGIGKTQGGVMNDFCRVLGNCVNIKGNTFDDSIGTKGAHFDAIQTIPRYNIRNTMDVAIHNSQYASAKIEGLKINDNTFISSGDLQAIFASDGYFKHIEITNNRFQLRGQHYITFNGLISGACKNNYQIMGYKDGNYKIDWEDEGKVPVRLNNGRIGGAPKQKRSHKFNNLWVKSFKLGNYQDIEIDKTHNLLDTRGEMPFKSNRKINHEYLEDFDREGFITEVIVQGVNGVLPLKTNALCLHYQKLAKEFSSKVTKV